MKNATVTLSRDEAEKLSSLLSQLTGKLQYRAVKDNSGSLDNHWQFWRNIEKKVANSIGFEGFAYPSPEVTEVLS